MGVGEVPRWGVVTSAASPVILAAGWTAGAALQPRPYNPVAETVSLLAGLGAADRWVMTLAFALAGACEFATGLALRPAAMAGRLILLAGGASGVVIAWYPVHAGGSLSHGICAVVGLGALALWPVAALRTGSAAPWALRPGVCAGVTVVLLILLAWFGLELVNGAGWAGLAERVLGTAQATWPFVVVMSCAHPLTGVMRRQSVRGYK